MSDRIKEWDEYFGIHCHLPAAAIRDLFDEIERLRAALEQIKNNTCEDAVFEIARDALNFEIVREALRDA